jgi:hypothetical protein
VCLRVVRPFRVVLCGRVSAMLSLRSGLRLAQGLSIRPVVRWTMVLPMSRPLLPVARALATDSKSGVARPPSLVVPAAQAPRPDPSSKHRRAPPVVGVVTGPQDDSGPRKHPIAALSQWTGPNAIDLDGKDLELMACPCCSGH